MATKMTKAEHDNICRKLTDQGKLIEAGFIGLKFASIPADAPEIQVEEMRNAFFAGAQHLFSSIMGILEAGSEPTAKDLDRMELIARELDGFIEQFKAKHMKATGRA